VRATKNIAKNFGRAICNFSLSSLATPYLIPLLEKEGKILEGFVAFINSIKGKIDGLLNFQSVIMPSDRDSEDVAIYKKVYKLIGEIFIKYFSVNWIFHSKVIHKAAHLKFRFKMLRRIKSPELFTYLK